MIICGVDLEGGGGAEEGAQIDTEKDLITEIGLVLWDTDIGMLRCFSTLCWEQGHPFPNSYVQKKTGISSEMLMRHGRSYEYMMKAFLTYVGGADYWMAWNGAMYDEKMLRAEARRQGIPFPEKTLIDPVTDIDWPEDQKTRAQIHTAAEHGILNPFPHRALPDVLTMMQVVSRYDPAQMVTWAKSPVVWLDANVSIGDKEKAKECQYRWNQEEFPKRWTKKVKECNVGREMESAKKLGFSPLQLPLPPVRK